ncbi:hypothetical protein MAM1_0124c05965 [Mucor ambiguus]|uniref:F-box domain-containing protein n=1 Tax=Mucor ambiguus TaxID=91626 RepID=A0A0C9M848_9FUNG|nr:hypothetical protein MAM1_0124c05965 [Mucor ambiguus]
MQMNSSQTTVFTNIPETLLTKILNNTNSLPDLAQYCLVCKSWNGLTKPLLRSRYAAKISDIPGAITNIIYYTDSVADLAKLRLVCKSWNAIAEPLMFRGRIKIKSSYAALALYGHLYKQPSYGKFIKYLHFDDDYIPMTIQRGLLNLSFTPNMERITGEIDDDDFYLMMNSIADKSRDKFDKLEAIPHPSYYSVVYNLTLLNFKSTLQEIIYSLRDESDEEFSPGWDFSSKFESFVNLVKLELEADLEAVFDLEGTLIGCSRLQELTLKAHFNDKVHVKSEVEAWAPSNVKIVDTVRKLVIARECRSDLLEYLLFKYPNTSTIDIDAARPLITANNNLHRTLNAIKTVRYHKVKIAVNTGNLIESLRFLIADGIRFRLNEDKETETVCIEISNLL